MSAAVNFSSLSSVSTLGSSDQLLVRFNNSLSGSSGFGRITKANLLSDRLNLSGGTITGSLAVNGTLTTTLCATTYIAAVSSTNIPTITFSLSNGSKTLIDTYSTTTIYKVPTNTAVPFSVGSQITIIQGNKTSSNYTTISAASGVTINSYNSSLSLAGNFAACTLIKTDTNTWYLIGNLL